MKLIKAALMTAILSCAGISTANASDAITLGVSRFEQMNINELAIRANRNNPDAQFYLAKRYQKGIGIAQDSQKAIEWYTRAAEQDIAPAQLNLGIMYARGEGVEPNEQLARKWLEAAAKRGDNRASYTLALMEEHQQKLADAYKWYDLSSRDGMLDENIRNRARSKIGQLALNLSNDDMTNARNQATTWFQSQ